MGRVIDIRGILEARQVVINAQRVADRILEEQRFHSELEKRLKEGTLPRDSKCGKDII